MDCVYPTFYFANYYITDKDQSAQPRNLYLTSQLLQKWPNCCWKDHCGQPVDLLRYIRPAFIRCYQAAHFVADFRVDCLLSCFGQGHSGITVYSLIRLGNKTRLNQTVQNLKFQCNFINLKFPKLTQLIVHLYCIDIEF